MAESFSAKVERWARETEQRARDVFREAALQADQEVSEPNSEGGHLPVVSGNLRKSRAASTIGPPQTLWRQKEFSGTDAGIASVIRTAEIGQTVWIGFQALYAMKAEENHGFVRLTAQRWPQIVEQAIRVVKGRSGE